MGQVWFNTTTGELNVYNGTTTENIDINAGQVLDAFNMPLAEFDV